MQESVQDTSAEMHRSFPGVLSSLSSKDKVRPQSLQSSQCTIGLISILQNCHILCRLYLACTATCRLWKSNLTVLQVLKYIAEREAAAATEADDGIDPAALKLMWGVLRLLSQNRGSLTSAPEQAKAKPVQPSIGVLIHI